jgi:endoglucanase
MLDAHLDQVGMVVTAVDDKGFIKVAKVGSPDPLVLAGAEVIVHGKKDLAGVVTSVPPHLRSGDEKKAPDIKDISVNVFLDKDSVKEFVSPGDRVTYKPALCRLLGDRVCGTSLDDRSGVLTLLLSLEKLGDKLKSIPLTVVFSVCEETGGSGASVAGFAQNPDRALAVDVSFAKAPGVPAEITADLSDGAMIGFAPSLDRETSLELVSIAEREGLPHVREIMGGRTGTNADEISVAGPGVKTALISLPLRNMHTPVEVLDLGDVDAAASLIAAYVSGLTEK